MEFFIKKSKLTNNCKAIIKTKWQEERVRFNIFVVNDKKDKIKYYKGECCEKDISKQCKSLNVDLEKIKEYLTSNSDADPNILFNIENNKFIIFMKEYLGGSENDYADIIYFKQSLSQEVILSKEYMEVVLEQINDLEYMTTELADKNSQLKKYNEDMQQMSDRYEKLVIEKSNFEETVYDNVIHLLNSKKKFILDNIAGTATKLNVSSVSEKPNDSLIKKNRVEETIYPSTSKTPTKKISSSRLNRTPTSVKRTPSKRFQLQQISDSDDDSFTVVSCDNYSKTSSRAFSNSLDSSRVFKDFKIKTPVKEKNKRESSVELKIEKLNDDSPSNDIENNRTLEKSGILEKYQNAQKIDSDSSKKDSSGTLKGCNDDEEIPCSQELIDFSSSYYKRKCVKSSKSQKKLKMARIHSSPEIDPFEMDTVNILNCT